MAQGTEIGFDLTQLNNIFKQLDKSLDTLLAKSDGFSQKLSSGIKVTTKELKQLADELDVVRKTFLGGKVNGTNVSGIGKNLNAFGTDEKSLREYISLLEKAAGAQEKLISLGIRKSSISDFASEINKAKKQLESMSLINNASALGGTSFKDSMKLAKQAGSINQIRDAIEKLTIARDKENTNTKRGSQHYEKLTAEIDRLKGKYNELTGVATKSSSKLAVLGSKLGMVFSVYSLVNYTNQLMKIRGEFEMQQRSLEVLLQNKEKADMLWDKTVALAIKSPFRVGQLVTYTKQLAAYRVETDKLYDTTRMLADISAGLGVDMQRLILAYGQVKAATYLRGTELRQFTEAGIPMLDELAKRFSELEGRAVGVDEVFARISKRMVTFKDVDAVLRKITSEGGVFYRMQEEQSETLKGQMSNLRDAIDVMMNDIGKSMDSSLKGGIKSVRYLVSNWRDVYEVMKLVIVAYGMYRMNLLLTNKSLVRLATSTKLLTKEMNGTRRNMALLHAQMIKLGKSAKTTGANLLKAFKSNWLIAAIYILANSIGSVVKHFKNVNEVTNETISRTNEHTKAVNDLIGKLKKLNKEEEKGNSVLEKKKELLQDVVDKFNEGRAEINLNIADMSQDEVDSWLSKLAKSLETSAEFERIFSVIIEKARVGMEGIFHILGDNIETDAIELQDAYMKLSPKLIKDFNDKYLSIIKADFEAYGDVQPQYEKRLKIYNEIIELEKEFNVEKEKGNVSMMEELEHYTKLKNLATELTYSGDRQLVFSDSVNDELEKFDIVIRKLNSKYREIEYEINKNVKRLAKAYPLEDIQKMTDEEKMQIYAKIVATYEPMQVDDTVKEIMARVTAQRIGIPFVFDTTGGEDIEELWAWQEEYNKFIKDFKTIDSEAEKGGMQLAAAISKRSETRADVANDVKKSLDEYKKLVSAYETSASKIGKQEYENYKKYVTQLESAYKWLLGVDEKNNENKDTITEMVRTAKELYTTYKELLGQFDSAEAKQGAIDKFGQSFLDAMADVKKDGKAITIDTFDMFSEEGVVAFFKWLKTIAKTKKEEIKAELAAGEFTLEGKVEFKKEQDANLIKQLQDRFDQYSLTLELKKLNIPQNIGEGMFGITYTSLEDMRKLVNDEIAKVGEDGQEELLKQLNDLLKKIEDEDLKAQRERMKKYIDYARDSIGEMAKIKLEEMEKLAEIDRTFTIKDSDDAGTIAMKTDAKNRASEKARQEARDAMRKYEWSEFEGSDTYLNIFRDLDQVSTTMINHMLGKLEEFKKEWSDMPLDDMRRVVEKINELETALIAKNPWEAYEKSIEAIKKSMQKFNPQSEDAKATMGTVDTSRGNQSDRNAYFIALQQEIALREQNAATIARELADLEAELRVTEGLTSNSKEEKIANEEKANLLRKQVKNKQKEYKDEKKLVTQYQKDLNQQDKIKKEYEKKAEAMGQINQMANDLNSAFSDLVDVLGGGELAGIFMDMNSSMMNTVLSTIQLYFQLQAAQVGAEGLGEAMNTAMGVIGWIVMAIQLIVEGIKAVVAAQEKIRERQIESYLDKVEKLSEAYDKLADAAEEAWDIHQLVAYRQELGKTYDSMIANQKAAIAVMETAKKVRKGLKGKYSGLESDEWKEYQDALKDLKELEEKAAETAEAIVSHLTDGIFDSVVDAARGFTDAWADAFEETGSGLSGLEDNFKDTLLSMAKQQATILITGRYTDQWKKMLEQFVNDRDMVLTVEEAKKWAMMVRDTFGDANAELEAYLKPIYDIFSNGNAYNLTGLEKGIQGITEDTAQVLAAYFNAIRGYTANIDAKMDSVVASIESPNSENPVLNELRKHTYAIESIRSMLDASMTTSTRGFNVKLIN